MKVDNLDLRDLARILLQHRTGQDIICERETEPDESVFDKLRIYLSKLVGVAGFHALLARALSQAKLKAPSLKGVRTKPDGTLEGLSEVSRQNRAIALEDLLVQLLGLLIAFIGEELTTQLMHDIWPDTPIDTINFKKRPAS
jgi:hypothetical protein